MNNASPFSEAETSNSKETMSNEDQSLFDDLFLIIMETINTKAKKDMTVSDTQTLSNLFHRVEQRSVIQRTIPHSNSRVRQRNNRTYL